MMTQITMVPNNTQDDQVCDNLDNNCNGQSDENVGSIFYIDADGDGFGDADLFTLGCEVQDGLVSNSDDCDDGDELKIEFSGSL